MKKRYFIVFRGSKHQHCNAIHEFDPEKLNLNELNKILIDGANKIIEPLGDPKINNIHIEFMMELK